MLTRRTAIRLILVISVMAVLQNGYYWLHLPDRVAIHFNGRGTADNWASRDFAVMLMLGLQLGFPAFFLTLISLVSKLPNSMINVPHREFWLAPERREKTLNEMAQSMAGIAVAGSIFLLFLNHLTFIANQAQGKLPIVPFGILLVSFITIVLGIAGKMTLRYRRVPTDAETR